MRAGLGELGSVKTGKWLVGDEMGDLEEFGFLRALLLGGGEEMGDEEALVDAVEDVEGLLERLLLKMLGL